MSDSSDTDKYETLIQKSFLIESLKYTLYQMVEGHYIRKETSDRIIYEASRQLRKILYQNSHLLPQNFIFGQLSQYTYFKKQWIFNVKDPVIYIYSTAKRNTENSNYYYPDEYIPRTKSNLSKDIARYLNESNSNMYCYKGFVKIIAVKESKKKESVDTSDGEEMSPYQVESGSKEPEEFY